MSARRAMGAAAATALAVMALRALDRAEEARAVLSAGAREAVTVARDPDLIPLQQSFNLPDDGGASNRP